MHLTARLVRLLLVALLAALPAAAVVPPDWTPRPGEYVWEPQLAPSGPVVVVVSLPLQQMHVYRNGVRIGASTISSGKPGHETPLGVFTILQKKSEHYSNLYNNAPMPWMQRLTWDGVALHAGRLPGHPASHGCIRLPDAFAKALFGVTRAGDVVVVTDRVDAPGLVADDDLPTRPAPTAAPVRQDATTYWAPERAPGGPVSIVLSTADARLVVTRGGVRIGSAPVRVAPGARLGTHAYVLLEGAGEGMDPVLTDRPARRWMRVGIEQVADDPVGRALREGALELPVAFVRRIDGVLRPGTTVLVTDAPLGGRVHREPLLLESDDATPR